MGRFSDEQMRVLRANVNVLRVTEKQIEFTEDFKRRAYEAMQDGKRTRDIFRENGIDPEILGGKRLDNFGYHLNRRMREGKGFSDQRMDSRRSAAPTEGESLEEQVRRLQHELAYTRQEVEFLKKLQKANTEARERWESKHRPK